MDYKRIIKSQNTRVKIIQAFDFIPDKVMLKIQYRIKTGHRLDLDMPRRYTEKLQWYKLYYRNTNMKRCVDKNEVRQYVAEKGIADILNNYYGVFDSDNEIDFDRLPNKFVAKDTLGSGSERVIVVDKKSDDLVSIVSKMKAWIQTSTNKKDPGREWVYDGMKHRIIIEEYLEDNNGDLADYKFFCFNGKIKCFYVRSGYAKNHESGRMAFFDSNKNILAGVYMDYCQPSKDEPILPSNIDDMIRYAEILSKDFPHARIDLYNVNGKIYFGEITFFNASGYMRFTPDEFDYELGNAFILPSNI